MGKLYPVTVVTAGLHWPAPYKGKWKPMEDVGTTFHGNKSRGVVLLSGAGWLLRDLGVIMICDQ
jgi:hypothetical protein